MLKFTGNMHIARHNSNNLFSHQKYRSFHCFLSFGAALSNVLIFDNLICLKWCLLMILICISSIGNAVDHLFLCLFAICNSFPCEIPVHVFVHFFLLIFLIDLRNLFYILGISPLSSTCIWKFFPCLYALNSVFQWIDINFNVELYSPVIFVTCLRNSSLPLSHKDIPSIGHFQVLF